MRIVALWLASLCTLEAAHFYVTVAGLGGEPEYEQRFAAWAQEIDKVLRGSGGPTRVTTLHGPQATRARLSEAIETVAREAAPQDALVLMLIGHGSFDGYEYKFNLPGPDLSAAELAALLGRVRAARQVVINMTSASGGSLAAFQKAERVVITATRSGMQKDATIFPRYWIEALRDPAADADKNEVITALEAYRYADQKTVRFFETQKRLASEHALLEDTGGGEGVRAPSVENGRGLLAGAFPLVRFGRAQAAAQDPEKRKLAARREELEQQIDQLKYQKAALPLEEYRKRLAALLLELAKTQAELDK